MAAARPATYLNWTDGSPSKVTQPPSPQQLSGWVGSEKAPFQYMNWLFYTTDQWIQYLDEVTNPPVIQATETANFTAAFPIRTYLVNPAASNANATLPAASANLGVRFTIKNIALGTAKTATVLPTGADTLEQDLTYVLNPGDSITLESDGVATWWQVQ